MSTAGLHALVVDDEARVRDLTSRALTASGLQCDTAADGEEAFRMACRTPYDAVVTDLRMPHRNGHALCGDLLRLPDPPSVVVLTALSDPRLVSDLMSRGVHDVIQKPVDYNVLAAKVQIMLQQKAGPGSQAAADSRKQAARKKTNLLHHIESQLAHLTERSLERLEGAFDNCTNLAEPPPAVQDFIRDLAEKEAATEGQTRAVLPSHEARAKERVTCYTTAFAVPMNRDWRVCGEPFKLALRDLSESGGRLLHTRAATSPLLALSWNATQLVATQFQIAYTVRRCAPCGRFYDFGGQFTPPSE